MRILFVHQNFPAQFRYLAPALVEEGHQVLAIATNKPNSRKDYLGIPVHRYKPLRPNATSTHPWLVDLETKVIRGDAVYELSCSLKQQGFEPDLIVAHPGWGEAMFIKTVWPNAKLLIYCEYFYQSKGGDVGFDLEFLPAHPRDESRIALKNLNNILSLQVADAGMSPTSYQAGTFPEDFRAKISVIHDGINTKVVAPNSRAQIRLRKRQFLLNLSRQDEIVTFVNRNLEPYRGYHSFMRALPEIMKQRPKAHILIIGGDGVSYGQPPTDGKSWKELIFEEVQNDVDQDRVHFLGQISYQDYLSVLQISTVHVYLTYPFVLGWSLLEAMSVGCAIVASDTPPVQEVIKDGQNGRLVGFFDRDGLAAEVLRLFRHSEERYRLGAAARRHIIENYDLESFCLPSQISLINSFDIASTSRTAS